MNTIVLLAPGPSMSQGLADSVRHLRVGAVGRCWELAPWAEFLVSTDVKWWKTYPEAKSFAGEKFSPNDIEGVTRFRSGRVCHSTNSGAIAVDVAITKYGADRVLLLGFDMHGSHYFGEYTNGLNNTPPARRRVHLAEYQRMANAFPDRIINCTPGSVLRCFPTMTLEQALA